MKKILITALIVCSTAAAFGQGAVAFSNSALYRLSTANVDGSGRSQIPTTPGLFNFGLFYLASPTAPDANSLTFLTSQLGVNSTTGPGLIADPIDGKSAMNTVMLPGTTVAETDIWLQVRAWSASYGSDWAAAKADFDSGVTLGAWGESEICNINALGKVAIAGVAIWEGATGTNPKLLNAFVVEVNVPEPSTLSLLGLGAVMLLIRQRGK